MKVKNSVAVLVSALTLQSALAADCSFRIADHNLTKNRMKHAISQLSAKGYYVDQINPTTQFTIMAGYGHDADQKWAAYVEIAGGGARVVATKSMEGFWDALPMGRPMNWKKLIDRAIHQLPECK